MKGTSLDVLQARVYVGRFDQSRYPESHIHLARMMAKFIQEKYGRLGLKCLPWGELVALASYVVVTTPVTVESGLLDVLDDMATKVA